MSLETFYPKIFLVFWKIKNDQVDFWVGKVTITQNIYLVKTSFRIKRPLDQNPIFMSDSSFLCLQWFFYTMRNFIFFSQISKTFFFRNLLGNFLILLFLLFFIILISIFFFQLLYQNSLIKRRKSLDCCLVGRVRFTKKSSNQFKEKFRIHALFISFNAM